jgi:hypothetical protein
LPTNKYQTIIMKKESMLTLAALAVSLLLSSCDKEELAPRAKNGG